MGRAVALTSIGVLIAGLTTGAVVGAAPAGAAQTTDTVVCAGHELTIRVNENNSGDNGGWSAVQVTSGGSGHLIPVSFSGTFFDVSLDEEIFSFDQPSGGGHGHNQQATTTCTQHQEGTLGDFLQPGDEIPPGAALTDDVTFDFTVQVVWKS